MGNHQEQLIQFLCRAKKEVGAHNSVMSSRPNTQDYVYEQDEFKYMDTCLGNQQIVGEEAIWYQEQPVWGMNYTGRVVSEGFDADFLKEVLKTVTEEMPYRGPKYLELGEYTYQCRVEGAFDWFVGCEKIFYKGKKVYEAMFQGGNIQ